MMNELVSAISLCVLVFILLGPYQRFRVDKVRQELFAIRDELFDQARDGKISFESEAYRATRTTLNGAIRFAHRLSFSRLIMFGVMLKHRADAGAGFTRAMNASSARDRELCRAYMARADIAMITYVFSSPLVIALIVPQILIVVLARFGYSVAEGVLRKCKSQIADFNRVFYLEGRSAN
jgi:hypothetical protein